MKRLTIALSLALATTISATAAPYAQQQKLALRSAKPTSDMVPTVRPGWN